MTDATNTNDLPHTSSSDSPPHRLTVSPYHRITPAPALRLGMRLIRGLSESHARALETAVATHGPFTTIESLWRTSGVPVSTLVRLARADSFNSLGLCRRDALWHIHNLRDEDLPLFQESGARSQESEDVHGEVSVELPAMRPDRQVVHDYATLGLSLKAHPMSFLRDRLNAQGAVPCSVLRDESRYPHGTPLDGGVAGIVLCRQRPGTASGIVFMTIEDETGVANLIVRPKVWAAHRTAARHSVCILVRGHIERQGEVVHVIVRKIEPMNPQQPDLPAMSRDFH